MQSLYVKGSAGDPLPTVFQSLDDKGARLLRGQLCLVAAGPGTGKSAFVLTYAVRSGVPTLYFSADSDAFTQLTRMVSIQTGWPMSKSAKRVRDEDLDDVAEQVTLPIRFNYSASPTIEQIKTTMDSFLEVYEDYPALVVIDNITNVRAGGLNDEDPFAGLESMMDLLHEMARDTGACVIGLHHVTGEYNNGDSVIPLGGVKGQIARVPEMVLTLHRAKALYGADTLNVSIVKNRSGRMDPSGHYYAELEFTGDTMQIKDSPSTLTSN